MNIYLYHLTQDNIVKYVGLTQQLARTKTRHRKEKPSHQFVIVETYHNREEAGLAEQYHIAAHKTFKGPGWNKTEGGEGYLDWVDISGENNPNWKGGIYANDPKLWEKKRSQTPERKEYDRIRLQRPEVRLRHYMNRRIRVARNLLNSPISL